MSRSRTARHRKEVERHQDRVLSGKQPAGKLEIAAIQRHQNDLKHAADRGFVFSWKHADDALDFFPLLTHPRGDAAGTSFELVPAQKCALSILFGWRKTENDLRRFREAFISMARGNGKSPLAAAIGLMVFVADSPFTPGAEVVCAATTRAQATKYVWNQVKGFIRGDDDLNELMTMKRDVIEFPSGNAIGEFYPSGSDANNLDGGNFLAAIIDELHAMRELHREMIEKINTGLGKRPQDLKITITTAGSDRSTLWLEEYDYACKVLEGIIQDDLYFPYIWQADEEDDPHAVNTWIKANPLFEFLSLEKFQQMSGKAKVSPAKMIEFRRYKLNMRVSSTEKAFSPELWNKGSAPLADLDGCTCFGGLDLGWRNDLAAFVLIFPFWEDEDEHMTYEILQFCWLPEESARDIRREPFRTLIENGKVTVTDGNTTDHREILKTIAECADRYDLKTVAADPNNARAVLTELVNEHAIETFEFRQNCASYNEPVNLFMDALEESRIRHGGDRLLAWAADNVVLRTDSRGYIMPDKDKSTEKIDPIVALMMAFSEALFAEREEEVEPGIRAL